MLALIPEKGGCAKRGGVAQMTGSSIYRLQLFRKAFRDKTTPSGNSYKPHPKTVNHTHDHTHKAHCDASLDILLQLLMA